MFLSRQDTSFHHWISSSWLSLETLYTSLWFTYNTSKTDFEVYVALLDQCDLFLETRLLDLVYIHNVLLVCYQI